MAEIPRFDLFSGAPDRDAIWLAAVDGLANAVACMKQRAAKNPGHYFVFSASIHEIVAHIDTSPKLHSKRAKKTA